MLWSVCILIGVCPCNMSSFLPPPPPQVALGQSFTIAISEDMTRVFGCGKADHGVLGQRAISGDHHILFVWHICTVEWPVGLFALYVISLNCFSTVIWSNQPSCLAQLVEPLCLEMIVVWFCSCPSYFCYNCCILCVYCMSIHTC